MNLGVNMKCKLSINFLILLFILVHICLFSNLTAENSNNRDPYNVLFIGSSYFNYNNLPSLFEDLTASAGYDIYIDQSIMNGLYLADHVDRPITITKINERDWDYVILQGVGSLMAYPDYYTDHPVYPALIALRDLILANCAETRIIFCMPWAFEDGMTWVPGWTDTYTDMQLHIYNNTLLYSEEIGFEISPVGWAWNTVLEELEFPLHYLHMSDWNHPSLRGSYLMACTIFSTVYLETSFGLDYFADLPEDEVLHFQAVASNTVLNDLDLWNIIYTDSPNEQIPDPTDQFLLQNSPNPFNPSTVIGFQLSADSEFDDVELTIYNIKGQMVKNYSISNEQHSITWDGTDDYNQPVPSGIYFCRLRTGEFEQTKKMLLLK
jgi:flagellar hook capping protein FlgD